MKKSVALIGGIIVIGGLWFGGSWYTGTRIEASSPEHLARLNAELGKTAQGADVKVKQLSFTRGLLDSQARYAMLITDGDDEQITLEFDTRFEHGPFPLSALSSGKFAPTMTVVRSDLARTDQIEAWFKAAQNATTPLWVEAVVSYTGDADFRGGLAAAKIDQDGDQFDFGGANLSGAYTQATQGLKVSFSAPSFTLRSAEITTKPFEFSLLGAQLDADVKRNAFDVWTGHVESRADRFSASSPDLGVDVSISNLVYGGDSSEDERFINGKAYLRGKALTVNEFSLGDLSLTFLMNQLDGATLKGMHDEFGTLAAASDDGMVKPEELVKIFKQHGSTLLRANPQLALAPLSWKNAKGESTLSLHTEFGDPGNLNLPAPMIAMQVFKSVTLDVALNKPMVLDLAATLLQLSQSLDEDDANELAQQQYDALAAGLVQAGFAAQDGDALVSKVQYGNGKISVNGRDVSMGQLMGLMMAF